MTASEVEIRADSILGGLERSRPRRRKLAGVLLIAMAAAVGIGWWQAGGFVRHADTMTMALAENGHAGDMTAKTVESAGATAQQAENAEADTAAADAAASEPDKEMASLPAHIVTENPTVSAAKETLIPAAPSANPEITAKQTDAEAKSAGQSASVAPALAAADKEQVKAGALSAAVPVSNAENGKSAEAPKGPMPAKVGAIAKLKEDSPSAARHPHAAPAKARHEQKDGDVELIAALLNRVSSKSEPAAEEVPRKSASGAASQRTAGPDPKKNRKTGTLRDALASKPADSTEMRLKRCGSLGFFEAELCRFRACDGRWGRDAACPEYSQISSALP